MLYKNYLFTNGEVQAFHDPYKPSALSKIETV